MAKSVFSVRLSDGERAALEEIAEYEDRALGYIIRRCIQDYLEHEGFPYDTNERHKHVNTPSRHEWSFSPKFKDI